MNKYHSACYHPNLGDWSINGKNVCLPLEKVMQTLEKRKPKQVDFKKICWIGMDISNDDESFIGWERYHACDTSYPGILVEGGPNPKNLKYRMIDGAHRMRKMLTETSKTSSLFYVLSNNEFMALIKTEGILK